MLDLVIVGGGPAGLAAAMYGLRRGLDLRLVAPDLGGAAKASLPLWGHEDYLIIKAHDQVETFINHVKWEKDEYLAARVKKLTRGPSGFRLELEETGDGASFGASGLSGPGGSTGLVLEARTVICATGAESPRLGVPGEREYWAKGIGSHVASYAHAMEEEHVMVVGDGRRALDGALEAACHASRVTLLWTGATQGSLWAEYRPALEQAERLGVVAEVRVTGFSGDERCRRVTYVQAASTGNTSGLASGGGVVMDEVALEADLFYVETEPRGRTAWLDLTVDRNETGHLVAGMNQSTSVPGLFAAGDVCAKHHDQVIIALGQGADAALGAMEHLRKL